MGTWGSNWDNSYAAKNSEYITKQIITYTNTGAVRERISSISMPMGTGLGTFTAGDSVTGDGSTIKFYVYANGDPSLSSSHVSVSSIVEPTSGNTGTYPSKNDMIPYTIEFGVDIIVEPNSTMYFTFASNAEQSESQVLVWDNTQISGVVTPMNQVWRYNRRLMKWEKILIPKRYRNGVWEDVITFYTVEQSMWNNR